ncbi:MAG: dihydrodipicolinate synthase family protein, partial [Planctomycetaceae bacterium]|nr:dihydrodipicolinate synthase family protein [Planctomycetaceae bacterium]
MTRFAGVIPPIITPYDADGNLHEVALRQLVDWYAEAGCDGLWAPGGTGEGGMLSCDERVRMAELLDEYVERRMKIIFHVAAVTTADAVAATTRCQELGIDAICSMPPFCYGKSRGEIVDYYRRLADATDRPIFLYNLPDVSGV